MVNWKLVSALAVSCGIVSAGRRDPTVVVAKQPLELLGLFAQLQPIEKEVGGLQPDMEPAGDFQFLLTLFPADSGIGTEACRPEFPFQDDGPDQGGPHAIGGSAILAIDGIEASQRLLGAGETVEGKHARQARGVRLLQPRAGELILVINPRPGGAEHTGNVGGGTAVVRSEATPEVRLDFADRWLPGAIESLFPAQSEDELFLALVSRHRHSI